jgi:perosamine synthetase
MTTATSDASLTSEQTGSAAPSDRTGDRKGADAISPFFLDLTTGEIAELERSFGNILRGGTLILGPYTRQFESEFATYIGTKHAVALNSGTSALEVILAAHAIKGKRIAVPSNTNFATVAAIVLAGGQPVYMDMTEEYFVPNLSILEHTANKYEISGVLWVHIGGIINPDFLDIVEFCRKRGLFLVEDAAHAHGSMLSGIKAGALGSSAAFSFFPTKVMTTMEGGMITTNDPELAAFAKSMRNQGKRDGDFGGQHYDLGSSWRISEISACIGLIQLAKLDEMVSRRAAAAREVAEKLNQLGVRYCRTDHMDQASNYKFIVRLKEGRDFRQVKEAMKSEGVVCGGGVYEQPCHLQPVFKAIPYDSSELRVTESFCPRHICPPITSGTTLQDVQVIKRALERVLR